MSSNVGTQEEDEALDQSEGQCSNHLIGRRFFLCLLVQHKVLLLQSYFRKETKDQENRNKGENSTPRGGCLCKELLHKGFTTSILSI